MKTIEIISQDLFDKIRSRFTNLQMGDEQGGVTMDPREARFYDFDFTLEEHNLGRVSISINELGTLKVFYGQSILEDIDPISKDYWYDFLREMRQFAKRRLLRFDTRDITKSNLNKDDFQYLATNGNKEETTMDMNESVKFEGSSRTSYGKMQHAKVIVKHHKPVTDEVAGARKRPGNIKAVYVENEDGERFKYPFIHTAGALAMAQHVSHGGKPYDERGNAIIGMSHDISECVSCLKHMGRHDSLNAEAHPIAERVHGKLQSLKDCLNKISGPKGYRAWSESWQPEATMGGTVEEVDQATFEDYKSKFTQSSFKEELAQFFPLINRIMKEAGTVDLEDLVHEGSEEKCNECGMWESECACDHETVKEGEFEQFESWAESTAEGTLEPQTIQDLKTLLSTDSFKQVGPEATGIIQGLQGINIHDNGLESALTDLAGSDPSADPKFTIVSYYQKADPQVAQELAADQQQPAPQQEPAPDQSVDQQAPVAPEEQPTAEGEVPAKNTDIADKKAKMDRLKGKEPSVAGHLANWLKGKKDSGATYEEEENEDEIHDKAANGEAPTMKDLAHWLCGHYNADFKEQGFKSPWRKGVTELGIMAEKEFGPQYSHLVKELMTSKEGESALERIIRKSHERKTKTGEADEMQSHSQSPLSNVDNPRLPKGPEEEEQFEAILRLAGLAK